jgi:hypothetical protein
VSVADLEKQVDELIARCTPLPPAKATGYKYLRENLERQRDSQPAV